MNNAFQQNTTDELKGKINEFWNWFKEKEDSIVKGIEEAKKQALSKQIFQEYPAILTSQGNRLRRVQKGITYEFSTFPNEDGKVEYYISPEGNLSLFPLVQDMVSMAPELKYIQPVAFRQPNKNPDFIRGLSLENESGRYYVKDMYFDYSEEPTGKFALNIHLKNFDGDQAQAGGNLLLILDKLIGEYFVATKIGGIRFTKLDRNKTRKLFKLERLPEILNL